MLLRQEEIARAEGSLREGAIKERERGENQLGKDVPAEVTISRAVCLVRSWNAAPTRIEPEVTKGLGAEYSVLRWGTGLTLGSERMAITEDDDQAGLPGRSAGL